MYERCTQLMSDWDTNSWCQSRTLQTTQHCIYSRYLDPEKGPPLSLSNGVNTCWWNVSTPNHNVTEHETTEEEKRAKQFCKIFPTCGSWPRAQSCHCPHKPILPFICPARWSVTVSAHGPDVTQNRPECSLQSKIFGEGMKEAQDL